PANALTRGYETQFMCGDALLIAPIVSPGGEVEIALPPGAWYDLASRQRLVGRQVIRYRATLEKFPVFGREGYALPLGPVVQHTGEIDSAKPLAALYLFGKPEHPLDRFAQANITITDGRPSVAAISSVKVEAYGEESTLGIHPRAERRCPHSRRSPSRRASPPASVPTSAYGWRSVSGKRDWCSSATSSCFVSALVGWARAFASGLLWR